MRLLVTGRRGQLAQSLQERATGLSGIELVLAGRPELDLNCPGELAATVRDLAPDIVLNAAAFTAVDQAEDDRERAWAGNAVAPGVLAQITSALDIPLIQISTDYVFAGACGGAHSEQDKTAPLGVYGESKLAGENAVRSANPRATIVRTAWVFSPFGQNFVKTMLALAQTRDEVAVVSDQLGSPTSALDLADGLLTLASRWSTGATTGQGETYHLAGSGAASWAEVAERVFAEAHSLGLKGARVRPIPAAEYPTRAIRPANSVLDCLKFARDFGFIMPHWHTSIGPVVARCGAC